METLIRKKRAPLVALNIRNEDAGKVSEILWEDYGIATRAGAHCAPAHARNS